MQIYVYVSFEKSSCFSLRSWVLWQQTTAIYFLHFSEKDDKMLNRWELFLNTPGLISHATSVNLKYERKTYVYRSTKVVKYTWPINTFNSTSILLELHCVLWFMLRIHTYAVVGTKWRLDWVDIKVSCNFRIQVSLSLPFSNHFELPHSHYFMWEEQNFYELNFIYTWGALI